MDLISREKALADDGLAEFHRYDDYSKMREYLKSLPSAFEGMTNGEVIQAVFGVMVLTVKDGKVWVERIFFPFDEVWWNAPYKAESEET